MVAKPALYFNHLSDPARDGLKTKPMPVAERRWLREYLAGRSATAAAKIAYPNISYESCIAKGQLLKKRMGSYMSILMEANGLDDMTLVRKLKEGLNAEKIVTSPTEGDKVIPDYATQHKFLTTAAKWIGVEGEGNKGGSQTNIGEVKILVTRGELNEGS